MVITYDQVCGPPPSTEPHSNAEPAFLSRSKQSSANAQIQRGSGDIIFPAIFVLQDQLYRSNDDFGCQRHPRHCHRDHHCLAQAWQAWRSLVVVIVNAVEKGILNYYCKLNHLHEIVAIIDSSSWIYRKRLELWSEVIIKFKNKINVTFSKCLLLTSSSSS